MEIPASDSVAYSCNFSSVVFVKAGIAGRSGLLVEAGRAACHGNGDLRSWNPRLVFHKEPQKAKGSVARKLAIRFNECSKCFASRKKRLMAAAFLLCGTSGTLPCWQGWPSPCLPKIGVPKTAVFQ